MTSASRSMCGRALSLAGLLVTFGCTPVDGPDQNAQALTDLTGTPSASAVATAAQGLIKGMRGSGATQLYSRLGREGWNLDPGNPQNFPAFYSTLADLAPWAGPYATIKEADLVLAPLDRVTTMSAAQREGVRGFAKTIKAIMLLYVIRATDVNGALLDATASPTDPPQPIASKADVYTQIFKLLDEAQTHLQAAGGSFSFDVGAGMSAFSAPADFLKFNRAVRARADNDLQNWAAVLTDLSGSFLDTTAPLTKGVYDTYSLVSGDAFNPLHEGVPRLFYVHNRILNNAQKQASGALDARIGAKTFPAAVSRFGVSASAAWSNYPLSASPIAYLRNEELILLRAEANLGLGNQAAALADINFIRVNSGNLVPLTLPYTPVAGAPPTLLDELLYEKTYSLMWEHGSSSWLDARHYGKLAQLPHDLPGQVVFPYLRIADLECQARTPQPPGCTSPTGL